MTYAREQIKKLKINCEQVEEYLKSQPRPKDTITFKATPMGPNVRFDKYGVLEYDGKGLIKDTIEYYSIYDYPDRMFGLCQNWRQIKTELEYRVAENLREYAAAAEAIDSFEV